MRKLKIPHNAFVFVDDGHKALFLRNEGDEKYPNLMIENVFEDVNPSTHKQGSERPGRVSKAFDSSQRSAVEPVDWHDIEEHRFVAAAMEEVVRTRKVPALVVVAPPKMLADLRSVSCRRSGAHHRRGQQGSDQAPGRRHREAPDRGLKRIVPRRA
jgi:protein required for attachment to host cells